MMFHYIDYADTAVRTENRQRRENRGGKRVDKQMETETGETQTQREREGMREDEGNEAGSGGVQTTAGKGIPRANCQCRGAP